MDDVVTAETGVDGAPLAECERRYLSLKTGMIEQLECTHGRTHTHTHTLSLMTVSQL